MGISILISDVNNCRMKLMALIAGCMMVGAIFDFGYVVKICGHGWSLNVGRGECFQRG